MTAATDWDSYYKSVPPTARLTRKYTTRVLLSYLERYGSDGGKRVVEIGGANSCFIDAILTEFRPSSYDVVDTNEYGLSLLRQRFPGNTAVGLHRESVLALPPSIGGADVVFSVGLVEHFDPRGTARAVQAHLQAVRPGGLALITFPTPTWLYRAARGVLEALGLWKFPDERPLRPGEVRRVIESAGGTVLQERTLWPLVLTQHVMVARRTA
jgi:SAM-dependent methyltransferase